MFIRIRKEGFGYVLFERHTRKQCFVETRDYLEGFNKDQLHQFLGLYYPGIEKDFRHEFINPPDNQLELAAPIGMYMEITRRCTLSCSHCYKPDDPGAQLMSLDGWMRLIQELHDVGIFEVRLCGNEPTASPYFKKICEFASTLNLFLGINTNGFFGEKNQEELISLRPDFIAVSIDGNEISHNNIRGHGSYQKAVSLLRRLSKTDINRRINTVISALTIDTLGHTVQLANELGAAVSFLPFRPIGKNTAFNATHLINKHQMRQAVEEIMRLRQKYPHLLLLTYFDVLGEQATYHHSMDFNNPCPARKNGFIAYNGDFYPCDFLRYLGPAYLCGNVADGGFWPIWSSSPVLKRFQNLKHDKCTRCEHYMKKCYGGCISGSIASTGCPDDTLCFIDVT